MKMNEVAVNRRAAFCVGEKNGASILVFVVVVQDTMEVFIFHSLIVKRGRFINPYVFLDSHCHNFQCLTVLQRKEGVRKKEEQGKQLLYGSIHT